MQFSAFVFSCCFSVVFTFSVPFVRFYRFFCSAQPLLAWRGGAASMLRSKIILAKTVVQKFVFPVRFLAAVVRPPGRAHTFGGHPCSNRLGCWRAIISSQKSVKKAHLKYRCTRKANVGTTLVRRWSDVATTLDRRFFIQVHQGRVPNNIYDKKLGLKTVS